MTLLTFPMHGSKQYVEYLLAQREQLVQHIKLIDEVLHEWNIVLTLDHDTGKVTWHRTKGDSGGNSAS